MMHLPDPGLNTADLAAKARAQSIRRAASRGNAASLGIIEELRWTLGKLVWVLSLPVRIPLSLFRKHSQQ